MKGKPQVWFGCSCHKYIPTESFGFDMRFWSSGERCSFGLCESRLSCVGERMVILGGRWLVFIYAGLRML